MTSSKDELVTEQADVISASEIAEAYERWEAPPMVSVTDIENGHTLFTVKDIEKMQKEAEEEGFKAGFDKGRDEGLKAGQDDINQSLAYLQQIMMTLNTPLSDLDKQIEDDLINLVNSMTRQLVRRELETQPEHVIGAMRAAMAVLPINDRRLKIYLHPLDIELVKTGLSIDGEESSWQWIEDPLLTRGGVRLETADTTIDATVEAQINSVINKLLGEERNSDLNE